jgi:hypothetical protein
MANLTEEVKRDVVENVLAVIYWPMREADFQAAVTLGGDATLDQLVDAAAEYAWDHILGEPAAPTAEEIAAAYRASVTSTDPETMGEEAEATAYKVAMARKSGKTVEQMRRERALASMSNCDACEKPNTDLVPMEYGDPNDPQIAMLCDECRPESTGPAPEVQP